MIKKKAILIAEKPSLKRAIEEVYYKYQDEIPYNIVFTNFVGHVCTLAPPPAYDGFDGNWDIDRLPIIPLWNHYKIMPSKNAEPVINNIMDLISEHRPNIIINACDPDREGENIFNLFRLTFLSNYQGKFKRFWCNALTEKDILNALLNLTDIDKQLKEAAYCRTKSDWLIGMNFTEAVTTTFSNNKVIKIGRVKTPLLHICYERENAINNFVPSSKYQIKVNYKNGLIGTLFNDEGYIEFENKESADDILKNIKNEKHLILSYNKKQTTTKCPQLYKLSDIQIEAGKKYGLSAGEVLNIIQSLYEKKYMSYPRTSLRYISTEEANEVPVLLKTISDIFPEYSNYINNIYDQDIVGILKNNNRICNDDEVSKAGHTALIITSVKPDLSKLSQEEINIYRMVCVRLLSFFFEPLKESKIEVVTKTTNGYTFKSNYKTLIEPGFTVLLNKKNEYLNIGNIKKNNFIDVEDVYTHEVKAICPSRFTQADLVQIMENPIKYLFEDTNDNKQILKNIKGIGTEATRAEIINSLFKDGYCEEIKSGKTKVIKVTDFGMSVMNLLNKTTFAQVDLTAKWEKCLELVETGELNSDQYKRMIEEYVKETIEQIKKMEGPSVVTSKKINKSCPCCNGDILIGKKYYYCSNYKKESDVGCKFIIPINLLGSTISVDDVKKLLKGKTIIKRMKKDNSSWDQSIKLEDKQLKFTKNDNNIIGKCPCCGKDVIKMSWGYGCSNYKNGCKFGISNVVANKRISEKIVMGLLENGVTSVLSGFKNKEGKTFSARLILDEVDKKIKFSFK